MTSQQAAAATVLAIQTLVADNIGSPLTLAAILSTIIQVNAPSTITTNQTTVTVTVTENPNQTGGSPN
jgi:hypothetical protein